MAYVINNFDGSPLMELANGAVSSTLDIRLVGKNYPNYGSVFNQNFLYLLQNFAKTSSPSRPVVGQIWFDTTENRLKVLNNNSSWAPIGLPIVSSTQPTEIAVGTMWLNTNDSKLHVYDGTEFNFIGPQTIANYGITRFESATLTDSNAVNRPVVYGYIDNELIAIMAGSNFVINGFDGFSIIKKGINLKSSATLNANILGGVDYANRLTTPRRINGIPFDGTNDISVPSAELTPGQFINGSIYNGLAAKTWSINASSDNIASTIIARDSSGSFTASTVTANLIGNVSGNVVGSVRGNLLGADSSIVFSASTKEFRGSFIGNLTGNITGTSSIASRLGNGFTNAIPYQTSADNTSFISAPTTAGTVLSWNGSNFEWKNIATSNTSASAVSGGSAGQLLFQTGPNTTAFSDTGIHGQILLSGGTGKPLWVNLNSLEVGAATTAGSASTASSASSITGGVSNQIHYQASPGVTNFVIPPTIAGTYLKWDGSSFAWSSVLHADDATNLTGGFPFQIAYQQGPGVTGFMASPVDSNTYLSWNGSNFVWNRISISPPSVVNGANNITGGVANQIHYQTSPGVTDFITAPSTANTHLTWNGTNFVWGAAASTVTNAINLVGGNNNQIPFQVTPGATSFVAAPSTPNTYLKWNGSSFVWGTVSSTATNLDGGNINRIPYQTAPGATSFLAAPSAPNTYLMWNGNSFVWGTVSSTATSATNIAGGSNNQLHYQITPGVTSFVSAPSAPNTYLTWNGSSFVWGTVSSTATNIAGGSNNQLHYQTAPGATSFVSAPSTPNTYLTWNGSSFAWGSVSVSPPNTVNSANNITGGAPNQLHYQTASGVTNFVDAPSVSNTYLTWNGSTFSWNVVAAPTAVATANDITGGAAGQLLYQAGNNDTAFTAVGSAGQVLLSNGIATPTWANQATLSVGSASQAVTAAKSATVTGTIESAVTATTQNNNDNSNKVATTAFVQNILASSGIFTQSLTGNGYQKLPSGLIIQWLTGQTLANGKIESTLPITFPNAFFAAVISEGFTGGWGTNSVTVYGHAQSTLSTLKGCGGRVTNGGTVQLQSGLGFLAIVIGY